MQTLDKTLPTDCIPGMEGRVEIDYHVWGTLRKGHRSVGEGDFIDDMDLSITRIRVWMFGEFVPVNVSQCGEKFREKVAEFVLKSVGEESLEEQLVNFGDEK